MRNEAKYNKYVWIMAGVLLFCVIVVPVSSTVTQYNLTDGGYTVVVFNGTGNLNYDMPLGVTNASYLVVAGGGGGAGSNGGAGGFGGGGGGGVRHGYMNFTEEETISITVGAGGSGGQASQALGNGAKGGNSGFTTTAETISATGGGGGGRTSAGNGGSGGGGSSASANTNGGTGIAGQGYDGGDGYNDPYYNGGGGGGAGEAGSNAGTSAGDGGDGYQSSITGTSTYYAGGGGGGAYSTATAGTGGLGGGGNGSNNGGTAQAGTAGTGGGGGGHGTSTGGEGYGGAGGSGIIVIRYETPILPVAEFTSNVTEGHPPFCVQFANQSYTDITAWNWSFGDGTYSELENPTHTYDSVIGNTATSYTVALTVTNASYHNTETKTDYITAYPINASFTGAPLYGYIGLNVSFTDLTDNSTATSWNWSFGDGNYSELQNPTHSYADSGTFNVILNTSNAYSFDTETKNSFVTVADDTNDVWVNETTKTDYEYVTFTGTGAYNWTVPANVDTIDYLVVAGGGGGGSAAGNAGGGGGGGGGVLKAETLSVSDYVDIFVGDGGSGSNDSSNGVNGEPSYIITNQTIIYAYGGGGGGSGGLAGNSGGSGGGGSNGGVGGSGVPGQGHDGGTGLSYDLQRGGCGGGADEDGDDGTTDPYVYGGDGNLTDIGGWWCRYGGGGGGGADGTGGTVPGFPGVGGGGSGAGFTSRGINFINGVDGGDEFGGGGGGGGEYYGAGSGGDGGSGIVVIRYIGEVKTSFTSNVTSGVVPLTVQFNDTSSGVPTSWNWSFGDGTYSEEQNPSHEYSDYGFYDVNLYAEKATGGNWSNQTAYISVLDTSMFSNSTYIVIKNSTIDLFNYEVPFYLRNDTGDSSGDVIYTHGETRDDWSDIRFTARNENDVFVGVNYWIEETNATTAKVWAEVPYIPSSESTNLTFFFGNASLDRSDSNGRTTFKAFDDFEDGTLDYWDTVAGFEWQIVDDVKNTGNYSMRGRNWLTQDNRGGYIKKRTDKNGVQFSNYTLVFSVRLSSLGTDTCAGMFAFTNFYYDAPGGYRGQEIYSYQYRDSGYVSYNTGTANSDRAPYGGSIQYSTNTWYNSELTFDQVAGTMNVVKDGKNLGTVSAKGYGSAGSYPLGQQVINESWLATWVGFGPSGTFLGEPKDSGPTYTWIDDFRVQSYYNPEPYVDGLASLPSVSTNFSANITEGEPPLPVQFTDSSSDATSWYWMFGDGNTSAAQNPLHTYVESGLYSVYLNTSNTISYEWMNKTDYINVTVIPPVADFTSDPSCGPYPLNVSFTDTSTNTPTEWYWDFGDSNTSSDQNPYHVYNVPAGDYTVKLNASNAGGFNWTNKTNWITVIEPSNPDFSANETTGNEPLPVYFAGTGGSDISSWTWDIDGDDGMDYFTQNCTHNYTSAGTYTVRLVVEDTCGYQYWQNKTDYITVNSVTPPVASMLANDTCGITPLAVHFTDLSSNTPTSWYWEFGDGNTSTEQNPDNVFHDVGKYTIKLNASNAGGYSWSNVTNAIEVIADPAQDFSANETTGTAPLPVYFTGTGTGVAAWAYDVDGDGSFDYYTQNCTHNYTSGGVYTVNLRVRDSCSDYHWQNKTDYINVTEVEPTPTPTTVPTTSPTATPTTVPTTSPTATPTSSSNPDSGITSGWYIETCGNVTTLPATDVGSSGVTLNGNVTSFDGDTVWFRWGTKPGILPLATGGINVTSSPMNVSEYVSTGIYPSTTYYYRLCAECGCSVNEENFTTTAPSVTIAPVATAQYAEFLSASEDGFNVTGMIDAGAGLYTDNMGAMFWGLLILFFFVGIFMRQELPMIPFILAIVGMTLLAPILPPDWYQFVLAAAAVILAGSIIYAIYGKRVTNI